MQKLVSFETDTQKLEALDALASVQHRDRDHLLNEAVDNYLELNNYHIGLIQRGIEQADAGELIDHEDVEKMVQNLRRAK